MTYSTTYVAVIVSFLSIILPKMGINLATEDLTSTIQVFIAIGTSLWIMWQRTTLKKVASGDGDVTALGTREK